MVTWARLPIDVDLKTAMLDNENNVEPAPLAAETGNQCPVTVILDQAALLSGNEGNQQKLKCIPWAKREAWKHLRLALAPRAPPQ